MGRSSGYNGDLSDYGRSSRRALHAEDPPEPEPAPTVDEYQSIRGSKSDIKNLYNHFDGSGKDSIWSDQADIVLGKERLEALAAPYAIVQRLSRNKVTGLWVPYSIEVQSKRLMGLLERVFQGYDGWNSITEPLTFYPPFRQFFHRWRKLKLEYAEESDDSVHEEAKILIDILLPFMSPHNMAWEDIKRSKTVSFKDLWLLFPPGELVVTMSNGVMCICRVRGSEMPDSSKTTEFNKLALKMEQIDWNGRYCGFQDSETRLSRYSGLKHITQLDVYPLRFAPNKENIKLELLRRGQKFAENRGFHVRRCVGHKYVSRFESHRWLPTDNNARPISGRVIIDAYAFYQRRDLALPDLIRYGDGRLWNSNDIEKRNSQSPASDEREEELAPMSDLECLLAVPWVKGFDLATKEWCEFNIDDIEDPGWSNGAYDNLVLPEGEKELILALADRDRLKKGVFNDFLQRKDRGIIFLLCGPPGVGKTLTAEALADKFKIPLYVLGASDIGTSPDRVEPALKKAFECCRLWDALLLIDEADVFLATRKSDHLNRNELVAVFLRQLELYQGLMFLTTNRMEEIDDAFESRMDLILRYPHLEISARRKVWHNFLNLLGPGNHVVTDAEMEELAESELNGREIKNIIKTAYVLASQEGPVAMKQLKIVLNIRKRLDNW